MISTDRQHQLVYSISSLKQVRFITTEQDLSLASHFTLSSLESIKCTPFSRESRHPNLELYSLFSLQLTNRIEIRKPRSKPFLIATWYRPPNSSTEIFSHFESFVGKLDAENVEFHQKLISR